MDTTNLEEVASAIGPWTKLVWLESPTNPRQQISDIRVGHVTLAFHLQLVLIVVQIKYVSRHICIYI